MRGQGVSRKTATGHTCEDCNYWYETVDRDDFVRQGECQRHPPVWVGPPPTDPEHVSYVMCMDGWAQPITGVAAGCGEWEPRIVENGLGTFRRVLDESGTAYVCSECGAVLMGGTHGWRYCPSCGRRRTE